MGDASTDGITKEARLRDIFFRALSPFVPGLTPDCIAVEEEYFDPTEESDAGLRRLQRETGREVEFDVVTSVHFSGIGPSFIKVASALNDVIQDVSGYASVAKNNHLHFCADAWTFLWTLNPETLNQNLRQRLTPG
jgi:hypothetical protein